MFETLFTAAPTIIKHGQGPMAAERLRYLGHVAEGGAAKRTLKVDAVYLLAIANRMDLTLTKRSHSKKSIDKPTFGHAVLVPMVVASRASLVRGGSFHR